MREESEDPTIRSCGAKTSMVAGAGTPPWGTPARATQSRHSCLHLLGGIRSAAGIAKANCAVGTELGVNEPPEPSEEVR